MKKILYISPDFNYSCGVSKIVYLYLKYFGSKNEYEVHFITNGGDSIERLDEISTIKFKKLNFSRGMINFIHSHKFFKDLLEYTEKNRIDIIHTHHRFPEIEAVRISKKLPIKTITSAHSFVRGFKLISFKSHKIISVSNSISNHLIKNFNIPKEKLFTIYNPVDKFENIDLQEIDQLKRKLEINNNNKILLFIGRINKIKGCDTLLKAFNYVISDNPNITLLICGASEDLNIYSVLVSQSKSIKLIKPFQKNYLLYCIADIILLPSRVEPFGLVMAEAGAFGKPFIGGNTGGIAEFIEDGIDGLLIDPENHIELAQRIIYLLKNEDVAKNLGKNLYKKVKEKCDYEKYFARVEEIYESMF